MKQLAKLTVVAIVGVACAACSNSPAPATPPVASAPPASAILMHAPVAGASADAAPATGPALDRIMQRPGFAQAFASMDGAAALPAWAKRGGVDSPSQRVEVDGKTLWLAQACETQACQGGKLLLLIDPAAHSMRGVLVEQSGDSGASVQQLTWLGKPDANVQAFLKGHVTHK
jgi:hypothetical protein